MMISTKGRYALRVVLDLAENGKGGFIPMKDVAQRQEISLKYLEKILPSLVRAELIEGVHGKGGGYRLTKSPEQYSVGEILRCADGGPGAACPGSGAEACDRAGICRTKPVWDRLNSLVERYLDGVTVAELLKDERQAQ